MRKVPRLSRGKGFRGPEPFGCFNTGTAPVIMHSRTGKWLVGPEIELDDARNFILFEPNKNKRIYKGRNTSDKWWVYIYKSRKPAVSKFQELCDKQDKMNNEMRAEYLQAKKDSQSNNPEIRAKGIMALADY